MSDKIESTAPLIIGIAGTLFFAVIIGGLAYAIHRDFKVREGYLLCMERSLPEWWPEVAYDEIGIVCHSKARAER